MSEQNEMQAGQVIPDCIYVGWDEDRNYWQHTPGKYETPYLRNDHGEHGVVVNGKVVVAYEIQQQGSAARVAELESKLLQLEEQKHRAIVERDGLREVVGKLLTLGDGVPLVPGMDGWGAFRDGVVKGTVLGLGPCKDSRRVMFLPDEYDADDPHIVNSVDGDYLLAVRSRVFSTPQAAEKASKA